MERAVSLAVGYHVVEGKFPGTAYPATTCLDVDAEGAYWARVASHLSLCRIYFKGAPEIEFIARQARAAPFANIVIGNEPNLPIEKFPGGADRFSDYWTRIAMALPDRQVWYPSPSPGVEGWRDWITHPDSRAAIAKSAGIAVHAYGELDQIKEIVWWYSQTFPNTPLWLAEWNFGAGRTRDINQWARETIRPLLDWINTAVPVCVAATYFAWQWPSVDMPISTPVDAAGTAVASEIDSWIAANPWSPTPVAPPPPAIPPTGNRAHVTRMVPVDPVKKPLKKPDPVTAILDGLWAETEQLAAIDHKDRAVRLQKGIGALKAAIGR